MAETIQEAFLALSHRKGGVTFEGLAQWQLEGKLPAEATPLSRKIAIGGVAGAIGIGTLSSGIGEVHAQSNNIPASVVDTQAASGGTGHDALTIGKVDISNVGSVSAGNLKLDTSYPRVLPYDFSRPIARIDITEAMSSPGKPKTAIVPAPATPTVQDASKSAQSNIASQPQPAEVTATGPIDGSEIGDSISVMAGGKIPASGSASNLAISVFAQNGMPFLNPLCETPGKEADCAKTLDGIRMQEKHANEMANDKFIVYELGRNKQDRSSLTGDRYLEALERNLQLGDQITGADGEPARKFVLNVASGPGDKPSAAKAVEERATILDENADRLGVTVIRWRELADQHPEWFLGDGVHFNADGSTAMADLISKTVSETMVAPAPVAETLVAEPAVAEQVSAELIPVPVPVPDVSFKPEKVDITKAYETLAQGEQASVVPTLTPDTATHAPAKLSINKKSAGQATHVDITSVTPPAGQPLSLDKYAPAYQGTKKQNTPVVVDGSNLPVVEPSAPAPAAEQSAAPTMTPDQLAEALGLTALDNQIIEQFLAGGDIELAPITDFLLSRPDLAPPQDGFLTGPLPLNTTLDFFTYNPNTCQAERRVYPDQAAASKATTVIYNYLTHNDPQFTGLPPSNMEEGDRMSTTHEEHSPKFPAMDDRTVLTGSPGGSNNGPAFEPGPSNTPLEDAMVRASQRFTFNGSRWLNYAINDSQDLADSLNDLRRPNGKPYELVYADHPEHLHRASKRFFDMINMGPDGEVTGQITSYAPCEDGATLTNYDEVAEFTNQWIQQYLAATVPPAVVVPETPAPQQAVPVPASDVPQQSGPIDITDVSPTNQVVTDTQAPAAFNKQPHAKTPPVVTNPTPETTPEPAPAATVPPEAPTGTEQDTATLLEFPVFDNEEEIGSNITQFIQTTQPSSPWLSIDGISDNIGPWIVSESKARNINPLFIVASGKMENQFGTDGPGPKNNNYFGMKDKKNGGYLKFDTPQAGIEAFMDAIVSNIYGDGADGRYRAAHNIYEYFSIHQSGVIAYPGEDLDPTDRSGPGGKPDGNTADGYDTSMNVYISWTQTDHPNDKYDGNLYNPLQYYRNNIKVINAITGLALSTEDPQRSA